MARRAPLSGPQRAAFVREGADLLLAGAGRGLVRFHFLRNGVRPSQVKALVTQASDLRDLELRLSARTLLSARFETTLQKLVASTWLRANEAK